MGDLQGGEAPQSHPQAQLDRKRRSLRNFRLLLILPFAGTAILLAPLAILKKSSEIDVSLKVSRVSFKIGNRSPADLFNSVRTASLTLGNFQQVELSPGDLDIATAMSPDNGTPIAWQRIETSGRTLIKSKDFFASVTFKDVTLNELDIEPGSVITLSWDDREANYLKLNVDGAGVTGSIAAGLTLHLSCNDCEVNRLPARYDFDSKFLRFTSERKRVITFSLRSGAMTITFELPPETKLVEGNIYIEKDLKFTRGQGRNLASTIIGEEGKIKFEELEEKKVTVGPGDFVILDELEDFLIKRLQIHNGIDIMLHGRVGMLQTGPALNVDNRLPSVLVWLYARKTWTLYLNALVLIGTTALAILHRLKFLQEEEK